MNAMVASPVMALTSANSRPVSALGRRTRSTGSCRCACSWSRTGGRRRPARRRNPSAGTVARRRRRSRRHRAHLLEDRSPPMARHVVHPLRADDSAASGSCPSLSGPRGSNRSAFFAGSHGTEDDRSRGSNAGPTQSVTLRPPAHARPPATRTFRAGTPWHCIAVPAPVLRRTPAPRSAGDDLRNPVADDDRASTRCAPPPRTRR